MTLAVVLRERREERKDEKFIILNEFVTLVSQVTLVSTMGGSRVASRVVASRVASRVVASTTSGTTHSTTTHTTHSTTHTHTTTLRQSIKIPNYFVQNWSSNDRVNLTQQQDEEDDHDHDHDLEDDVQRNHRKCELLEKVRDS